MLNIIAIADDDSLVGYIEPDADHEQTPIICTITIPLIHYSW